MHSNRRRLLAAVFVTASFVGSAVSLPGCSGDGQPGPNEVFMRNVTFDPPEITIRAGESITWTNKDILPHTATSGDSGDADLGSVFQSGTLLLEQSFTHTFEEPGDFTYFCEVHPVMMRDAKVHVEP